MILRALYTQLNRAILLCDVIPDGKLSKLHTFWQAIAQVSEMSFPVVFHTENCAVLSGNPTLSSVYLPTPPWHHLKALNLPKWIKERRPLLHILRFLIFFSDNIMADLASKQQTTALFLSSIVTCTRRNTELTKKLTHLMGNVCCAREHSIQFFVQFFLHSLT